MRGNIMCQFQEMVLANYGMQAWESVIDGADLEGIYTTGMNYEDQELISLVSTLAGQKALDAGGLVQSFGGFLGRSFRSSYSDYYNSCSDFFEFLESVDSVIHVEVKKLHPDAELPSFDCRQLSMNELIMDYQSPRKMCSLAIGLIEDAAAHFAEDCEIEHVSCMHDGAPSCELRVTR